MIQSGLKDALDDVTLQQQEQQCVSTLRKWLKVNEVYSRKIELCGLVIPIIIQEVGWAVAKSE